MGQRPRALRLGIFAPIFASGSTKTGLFPARGFLGHPPPSCCVLTGPDCRRQIIGSEPIAETDAETPDTLHAADARGQFGLERTTSAVSYATRRTAANRRWIVAG